MIFQEDEVQTLTSLGLTPREARVFLILERSGTSTAKALTKVVKLPRQDTYKVLSELQQVGLVEKHVSSPTKFTALPIREVCLILLERRSQKTADLQQKTEILAKNFEQNDNARTMDDEEPNLLLIPEGEAFVLRMKKSIENAENGIDIISTRNASQGLFYLSEALKKATKKGVKIRFIVGWSELSCSQTATFEACIKNPYFHFKAIANHLATRFCIYDGKELSVVLSSTADFSKSSLLWSDCPNLVQTYREYYAMLWHSAEEINIAVHRKRKNATRLTNPQLA